MLSLGSAAYAADTGLTNDEAVTSTVVTPNDDIEASYRTDARHGYVAAVHDAPLADVTHVAVRRAATVRLHIGNIERIVHTLAPTVGDVLAEQHITLGPHDRVRPSLRERATPGQRIIVTRIVGVHHPKHKRKSARQLTSRLALAPFEARGAADFSYPSNAQLGAVPRALARLRSEVLMLATAYVANCAGCSGITALGMRAGHGIVAVDPRFIPLGTHLFIPGYGRAIAGDTGGAIKGNRIDLGFDSLAGAMQFGRREITVYILR